MSAAWKSSLPEFRRAAARAEDAGLIAAAQVGVNATKRALRGGYTSGDFVTGQSVNAVTKSEPFSDGAGRAIRYGTNLLYNLYWELGHLSIYAKRFMRVEKWRPAMLENREAMRAAYARTWTRFMRPFEAGGSRG